MRRTAARPAAAGDRCIAHGPNERRIGPEASLRQTTTDDAVATTFPSAHRRRGRHRSPPLRPAPAPPPLSRRVHLSPGGCSAARSSGPTPTSLPQLLPAPFCCFPLAAAVPAAPDLIRTA